MALPTVQKLKDYCRIETAAEDTLLADLLARAQAMVESYLGRPILKVSRTCTDAAETEVAYGRITVLQLQLWPFDPATVAVTDADGVTVDPATYRLKPEAGQVIARKGYDFPNGPYDITADVGLETAPDYSTRIEALASAAILDLAADLYQRRNPGATSESEGGGVSTGYTGGETMPPRTARMLAPLMIVGIGA